MCIYIYEPHKRDPHSTDFLEIPMSRRAMAAAWAISVRGRPAWMPAKGPGPCLEANANNYRVSECDVPITYLGTSPNHKT